MAYFDFEGKSVYYEEHGAGKPLVLLNGIMMSTASWAAFVEPLSAQNRLILVDFLDQGRSARMTEPFTHAIQVRLVAALLDHLALAAVSLMGISYGSEVALEFALEHPARVERLLLFNATAATGPWLGDIGEAWNHAAAAGGEAYYLTTIPVIYSPGFYKKNKDWMDARRKLLTPLFGERAFTEAMVRLTDSSAGYDLRARVHEIAAPTLVVSCRQDYLTPAEEQEFLVRELSNSHYVVLPDCGHASMYEQPLLFTALILGFVNTVKLDYQVG